MQKAGVWFLSALSLTGCAATRPGPAAPPTSPRAKPVEAMQPVPSPCLLPDWYSRASPDGQAGVDLNCEIVNGFRSRELERKHSALVDWINSDE